MGTVLVPHFIGNVRGTRPLLVIRSKADVILSKMDVILSKAKDLETCKEVKDMIDPTVVTEAVEESSGLSDAATAGLIWLGIFAFMIVAEIASVGLTAIWFAGGAVVASVAGFLGADVVWQIIIFMVVSLVLLIVLRPLAKKKMLKSVTPTNAESLIGQVYPVLSKIGPGHEAGQIRIGDVEWRAVSEDGREIPAGSEVVIRRIEGTKLIVH